ncbi:MAG TPA: NAD(P)/FAD-dependent oxidoreductase [Candidatus Limnocylindrales bacterium]|nr:NAD(P)/FAD-dependent oxidoreductase [Candidatus Limnocylindrales bacterium]
MADGTLDAVVVGAGPNGLAAAITLAREGRRVRILERAHEPGGGARSSEATLPGFVHDTCSAVHPFGRISPFFAGAGLERHGLRWIEPPAAIAHPLDGGRAVLVTRDVETTARPLGRDRDAYRRLFGPLARHFPELVPDLLAPFHIPRRPRRALGLAWFGFHALQPATLLARRFREPPARALLAGVAAHSLLRLDEPVSGGGAMLLLGAAHQDGWPFPEGGAGRITDALGAEARSQGVKIETGVSVDGLADLPESRVALFDTGPRALADVAGNRLPRGYRRRLRGFRYGTAVFKLDIAVDGPIPWQNETVPLAGTVHLGGTFEEIAASEADANAGRLNPRPFVLLAQQSLFDTTRAPAGKHAIWAYCHVPHGSTADRTGAIVGQIERFAPGFRERILAVKATNAADLEGYNPNNVGGDMSGGRMDLRQLFTRPVVRLDPYSTPDPRLFLCSSSTPPGGGVHGMCGWHAAHSALRRLDAG